MGRFERDAIPSRCRPFFFRMVERSRRWTSKEKTTKKTTEKRHREMSYDHNVFTRRGLKELAGSLKIPVYGNKADIAARIQLHSADSAAMLKALFDKCMAENEAKKRRQKIRTDKDTMLSSTRLPTDWLTDYGMKFWKEDVRDGERVYVYIKKSKSPAASKTIVKGGERSSGKKTGKTGRAIKFDFTTFTLRFKAAVDDRALVNTLLGRFFPGIEPEKILQLSDKKAYDHLANIMCYEEADS